MFIIASRGDWALVSELRCLDACRELSYVGCHVPAR